MSAFLAEVPFDHAGIINAAIDHRGRVNAVFENDSHLAMKVLLRERTEAARGIRREREIHLVLAGIVGVAILNGTAEVAASNDGGAVQNIPALAGVDSTGGVTGLGAAGNEFRARRQDTTMSRQRS